MRWCRGRNSRAPVHRRPYPLLNFFRVNGCYSLVDLPGYGWAKVSKAEREKWRRMVEGYLQQRAELRAVVIILDLRREPGPEEKDLIAYLTHEGIPPVLVVTKPTSLPRRGGTSQAGDRRGARPPARQPRALLRGHRRGKGRVVGEVVGIYEVRGAPACAPEERADTFRPYGIRRRQGL